MRIAEVFNVSADHLLFDDVPRRPLHAAEDALGDRLAVIGELSADDLAAQRGRRPGGQEPAPGHGRRLRVTRVVSLTSEHQIP